MTKGNQKRHFDPQVGKGNHNQWGCSYIQRKQDQSSYNRWEGKRKVQRVTIASSEVIYDSEGVYITYLTTSERKKELRDPQKANNFKIEDD